MKVVIERNVLFRSLNHVQGVVERRNTIPILSNVLLDATGGRLRLTATDLDLEIVEDVAAEIATAGATTAPAHLMADIVRKLPDGAQLELTRSGDADRLDIHSGRSRFSLPALPKEDFPVLTAGEGGHSFRVAAAELGRLIERTRFAISNEETRYYLNGIYLHEAAPDGSATLRAVATDGHRLAQAEIALPDGAAGMAGVIVPRKCVNELAKLMDGHDGEVDVSVTPAKIRFAFGDIVVTSKLIDGTFPDYERVIPFANDREMQVDAATFAEAVDRVSTVSSDKGRAVKLSLEGDRLTLSVNSPDSGSATEEIAVGYTSDPLEIGFNARYLLDITAQLESETGKFYFSDPGAPTLVRDNDDAAALYVLMPMRV
jgi:DNA polymerase-3 subunit beta